MPNLELDDEQALLLNEVLTQHLADMRYEIANTDNSVFRDELHERYDRLAAIAAALPGEDPPPTPVP